MTQPTSRHRAPSQAEQTERVARVPWGQVRDYFAREHQLGQHVAIEGPNGSGKSVLALELLQARGKRTTVNRRPVSITVMGVKPRDRTLSALPWRRMRDLSDWPPPYGDEQVVLWPTYGDPATVAGRQRQVFQAALREIMQTGNQIVYIDEVAYFEEQPPNGLGLSALLTQFWYMSRSNGVSLVGATQRPTRVSRSMWSEPYWLYIFRPEDEDDLKRIAELSGSKQMVLDVVPTLDTHEFLMLRRRPERLAVVSQVELAA